ncbi:MAG: tyrosine-type recombinase/integrase, partial [Paracoccus sp. (in: a-proteobacteria)]
MVELYQTQRAMRNIRRAALQRGVVGILDIGTSKIACLVLKFDGTGTDREVDGVGPMAGQANFRVIGAATTRSRGMRRGEIFRLRWSDLRDGHILLREPKGGMDATIPLNDATRRILDEVPRSDFPLVFPGRDGKVRTNAHKSLTRIKTLAALPDDFRILHGCRHVFASTGVSNGIDLYTM